MTLNRLVHEPTRQLILAVRTGAKDVGFGFLESMSGLSKGNLSTHVSKAGGLITVKKSSCRKRPPSELSIPPAGRRALGACRNQLAMVIQQLPETTVAPNRR